MEAPQSAMALAAAGEEEEQRGWVQSEPVAGGAWRRWRRVAAVTPACYCSDPGAARSAC